MNSIIQSGLGAPHVLVTNRFSFALVKLLLILSLLFIILNPYTIWGNLAEYVVLVFLAIGLIRRFSGIRIDSILLLGLLVFISLVGVFVSLLNGIDQFNHLIVSMTMVVQFLAAYGLYSVFSKYGIKFNDFLFCLFISSCINSSIIVAQVYSPVFRELIESFLTVSGNIDWKNGGFRYRGIASGGGASLSVLVPATVIVGLHLFKEKYLSLIFLIVSCALLCYSVLFIGRTGLLLISIVFFIFVITNFRRFFLKTILVMISSLSLLILTLEFIEESLNNLFGSGFFDYSLGFALEGMRGLEEEGTVGTVADFLTVMPKDFPEILIGYGFYGGSRFEPWTDSGLSRMFLSVGYVLGFLYYVFFFLIFKSILLSRPFLNLTLGAILMIAELKEPMLFSGYASRLYFFVLTWQLIERRSWLREYYKTYPYKLNTELYLRDLSNKSKSI